MEVDRLFWQGTAVRIGNHQHTRSEPHPAFSYNIQIFWSRYQILVMRAQALFKANKKEFISALVLKFFYDTLKFVNPQLLALIISFVDSKDCGERYVDLVHTCESPRSLPFDVHAMDICYPPPSRSSCSNRERGVHLSTTSPMNSITMAGCSL